MIDKSTYIQSFANRGYAISFPLKKIALPVSSSSYAYSHFKHVSGVSVPEDIEGVHGVTINRLKVIDVLMEQLSREKEVESGLTSDSYIDGLIEKFKSEIKQMNNTFAPYMGQRNIAGALFDLVS
ncbi:MAG: hypothetical protein LBD29_10380 [Treponema sp.]|jgi:hypothetical protein|nr:hypothetical protein [Treponema sp.]